MAPSTPRLFLLPARAGLESACVRLGPRREGFRFSPLGAWRTFGLGGRRYSWIRDVAILGRGPRPESSPAETAARGEEGGGCAADSGGEACEYFRAGLDASLRRRHAAAAAAGAAQQLDSMLRFWRDMPSVPSGEELARAAEPRPFEFPEPEPTLPDLAEERLVLEERLRAEVLPGREGPPPWVALLLGLLVALVAWAVLGFSYPNAWAVASAGAGLGLAAFAAALGALRRTWRHLGERELRRRLEAEWATRRERATAAWRFAWARWDLHRAQARVAWHGSEAERVARVRRLRGGDLEAVRGSLEATLADLDFPYEAACEVATDGDTAFVLLDLPGIDSIVSPVRAEVDAELAVTEVEVAPAERDVVYDEHVAGVALLVARAAFAAAPTLRKVQLAGYRQGPMAGSAPVEYVVETLVGRESLEALDPGAVDPASFLAALPGASGRAPGHPEPLPRWLSEAFGAYPLPVPGATWKN